MKKCPYCGKEFDVQVMMGPAGPVGPKPKWYFSTYWIVIAFLCIGPFALPFVWLNPHYKPITKWIVTVLAIVITIWLSMKSIEMYKDLMQQLKGL